MAQRLASLTGVHEDEGLIPGLTQRIKDPSGIAVSCGVGHRCSSDATLLWLWYPIGPLAWEPPDAAQVQP